jgi:hypothetical protein
MSQDDDEKLRLGTLARLSTLIRELDLMGGYRLALVSDLVAAARAAYAGDMRLVRHDLKNAKYIMDEMDDPLSDISMDTLRGMASNIMHWHPDYTVDQTSLRENGAPGYKSQDFYFNHTSLQVFRKDENNILHYIGGASNMTVVGNLVAYWEDMGIVSGECLVMFNLDREECRYDQVGTYREDGWYNPDLAHLRTLENRSEVTITIEDEEYQVKVFTGRNTGNLDHLRPDWNVTGELKNGEPFHWDQGRDGGHIRLHWGGINV